MSNNTTVEQQDKDIVLNDALHTHTQKKKCLLQDTGTKTKLD